MVQAAPVQRHLLPSMSSDSLGLTGLLADLLADEDSQNVKSAEPTLQRNDSSGDAKADDQIKATDIGRVSSAGACVDADLEGLLSGMNLQQPHSTGRAEPCSEVVPEPVPGDTACVPPPWSQHFGLESAAVVSHHEDDNREFRPYMEDGHMVVDPMLVQGRNNDGSWSFFGVYDGHGGRNETDYCQKQLHEIVQTELSNLPRGKASSQNGTACHALDAAFRKIDSQLAMLGAWNSGCTCTVVLLQRHPGARKTLYVANVGDSRAVLCGDGGVLRVTVDHRADDPAEVRRITAGGNTVHNNRVAGKLSVSRSLGDHHLKSRGVSCVPFTCTHDVECGHVVVIASDGLWDALSDSDAGDMVQASINTAVERGGDHQSMREWLRENIARTMVDRAKELGSRDNILALVVFI